MHERPDRETGGKEELILQDEERSFFPASCFDSFFNAAYFLPSRCVNCLRRVERPAKG